MKQTEWSDFYMKQKSGRKAGGGKPLKTEKEILDVAFRMFLEKGFSEISTNEIIREAGLTKGGFYYSFKSREELDRKVIEHYLKPFFTVALQEMRLCWESRHLLSAEQMLWKGFFQPMCFQTYQKWLGKEVPFRNFYFLLHEGMKKFPEVIADSRAFAAEKEAFLRKLLKWGQEQGEILETIDMENHIMMLLAMQDGILALKLLDDSIDDMEKYSMIQKQIWKEIACCTKSGKFVNGGVISAVS